MINLETQQTFVDACAVTYPNENVLSRTQINNVARVHKLTDAGWLKSDNYRVARGKYKLPAIDGLTSTMPTPITTAVNMASSVDLSRTESLIPERDPNFVKFGFYKDMETILRSKMFYPVFITGMSGNGKTYGSQQVCARLRRECITIPITIETDESDLLGDKTLVDGNVEFIAGPVVRAMESGAVLILDEIDLASNKIMCLQSIIDGKGVYLKKDNRFVSPAKGFTVIATANTKGKGSEDGRFIGTNVLNEAFLERFKITFEQEYPTQKVEKTILANNLLTLGVNAQEGTEEFIENLTVWASAIRKTFADGGIDEIISTRRLVAIVETFAIFKDRMKSVELCVSRFDDDTKESFLDLYSKISNDTEVVSEFEPETLEEVISDYATEDDAPY
jgi:MoxR-like ATPase